MHLRTLGGFELTETSPDGTIVRVMGPQKPLALIAYLAMSRGHRASRDQLLDLFWSDTDPDRGRKTLRQTVWSLRHRFGEDALLTEGDDVVLGLPLEVDCQLFEAALARGALSDAWAVYRGHFLPEFATPGGAGFEHWADGQREHLRGAWTATGEELVRQFLADHRPREAAAVARRLRDEFPDRLDFWRTFLQALLAAGDRMQALVEAEALDAQLHTQGIRPNGETRALLERIRALPTEASPGTAERPRPDLVGREQVFASLLTAWQSAVAGQGSVTIIRGGAGLGKTRLLQEFQRRLVDMGARTITVRARPADRDLPFGLVAALAEALGALPGAVGVSPGAASVLVDLTPSLSNVFARADRPGGDPDEQMRRRTLALVELLETVAQESPIAVLVDDLHWADEASRQLLGSLSGRIAEAPVLLAISLRPLRGGWPMPPGAVLTDLQPLNLDQVEGLVASMAACDPSLLSDLGRVLHSVSAGVPLLALSALELAQERRLLQIEGDHWACPNLDQLRQALADGSVLEQLLRELPIGGLALMLALALAGRPLDDDTLAAVAEHPGGSALALALEQRGLVTRASGGWEIAHDKLAEAAMAIAGPAQRLSVGRRLAKVLLEGPDQSLRGLRLAGRLLTQADDPEGEVCFRRWLVLSRRRRYWRDPVAAAVTFLGEEASLETARRLGRSVPRGQRFARGYPEFAAAVALLVVAVAAVGLMLGLDRWLDPPAQRMVLIDPPSSQGFLWDTTATSYDDSMPARNPVPISVDFRDASDALTRNTPDSARVRLVGERGVVLRGATVRAVRGGQAVFPDLVVEGAGSFQLEVTSGTLVPVSSSRLHANGGFGHAGDARLTIVGGQVNGQPVDSVRRVVTVPRGAEITGVLRFRVLTGMRDAAMLMGAVASWGDRRTNWIVLSALPPHGLTELERPLEDALHGTRFRAPAAPGRYHLMVVMDAETEMKYIASRTNWVLGDPRWFDGDDLVDLTPAELRQLDSAGSVPRSKLQFHSKERTTFRESPPLVGTTIEVVVGPR